MRHVLVPLHIVHAPVRFTAKQAGVSIVSHALRWNDERGRKFGLLYRLTAGWRRTRQCDAADGKFDGFGLIFYGVAAAWRQTNGATGKPDAVDGKCRYSDFIIWNNLCSLSHYIYMEYSVGASVGARCQFWDFIIWNIIWNSIMLDYHANSWIL